MREGKLRIIGMLLISTLLGAIGQFFFKYSFLNGISFMLFMLMGLISYAVSTAVYFYVLSWVHLSWAYSIGGISYVFAVVLAHFVLLESVPPLRWVGVLVISIGVVLIGFS
jgi:uncharacterized membrane protein